MFQESFQEGSRKFKGVSRNVEGCFNEVLSGFQGCLREVKLVFEEEFQRCFKDVLRVLQGRLRGVSMKF